MHHSAAHPELRRWAYRVYWRARRHGRVVPPAKCERCRERLGRLHGHHDDYSRPLAVRWHCAACHRRLHTSWEMTEGPDIFDRHLQRRHLDD